MNPPERHWFQLLPPAAFEFPYCNISLIILNQPLTNLPLLDNLWKRATERLVADGGANRLYDAFPNHTCRLQYIPDTIVGDLDSIRLEVLSFYSTAGSTVVRAPDSNLTDFMKCTAVSREKKIDLKKLTSDIVVMGGLGGRVDHAIATLNHMIAFTKEEQRESLTPRFPPLKIYLVSSDNLTFALKKGENFIHVDPLLFGKSVGILPLEKPAVITTQGLEWDVQEWKTEMGGRVSTSNHVQAGIVMIKTTESLLFTIEFSPNYIWDQFY